MDRLFYVRCFDQTGSLLLIKCNVIEMFGLFSSLSMLLCSFRASDLQGRKLQQFDSISYLN